MKTLLIIGAGFLQSFVIKKAKELGYYTITIDKNPTSLGFLYADEYAAIDITDQEACLRFACEKGIHGVMTAATDYGVLSASYVAEKMGLPGLDYKIARIIKNKYLVRHILFDNSIDDIAQYYEISDVNQICEIENKISYPVMVKPCDGSGSKAANRVDSPNHLRESCIQAMSSSLIGKALIEDFVEGKEYGVESFVYDGEAHVLGVMDKHMTNPPDYAELGHALPSNLKIEEQVKKVVKSAIKALGINFGAVNMDVLITSGNRICIVDIGARMGGNLIGSHIIPLGTGIDYMDNLIRASVGDEIDIASKHIKTNVVTRLLALKPGRIVALPDFSKIEALCQVKIYHHLQVGDLIRAYHNNLDGCGYVLATSEKKEDATKNAELAKKMIDEGIFRD